MQCLTLPITLVWPHDEFRRRINLTCQAPLFLDRNSIFFRWISLPELSWYVAANICTDIRERFKKMGGQSEDCSVTTVT